MDGWENRKRDRQRQDKQRKRQTDKQTNNYHRKSFLNHKYRLPMGLKAAKKNNGTEFQTCLD